MINTLFGPNEINLLVDLLLSIIAGLIIGIERESRGKDAGISTLTMVIIGAMLFTFMSSLVDSASESRIAAQIVSGIGLNYYVIGIIVTVGIAIIPCIPHVNKRTLNQF